MKRGTYWLTVAVTTSSIATLFNTYWDIFRDWGLMNRNSKNPWLRDKLLVPYKSIYFIVMVNQKQINKEIKDTFSGLNCCVFAGFLTTRLVI